MDIVEGLAGAVKVREFCLSEIAAGPLHFHEQEWKAPLAAIR